MQLMTHSSRSSPRRSSAPKRRMKVHPLQTWLTAVYVILSVGMASMKIVLRHLKAHCIRRSLACLPRVCDVQAFEHPFDMQIARCTCHRGSIKCVVHCMVLSMRAYCLVSAHLCLREFAVSLGLAAESSSDSEDDDNEDDDDEVEDSEGGEETCPSGCDASLYDKVISPSCLLCVCFTCRVESAQM